MGSDVSLFPLFLAACVSPQSTSSNYESFTERFTLKISGIKNLIELPRTSSEIDPTTKAEQLTPESVDWRFTTGWRDAPRYRTNFPHGCLFAAVGVTQSQLLSKKVSEKVTVTVSFLLCPNNSNRLFFEKFLEHQISKFCGRSCPHTNIFREIQIPRFLLTKKIP